MRLDFDDNEDSQAQVAILLEMLGQWLAEQPEQQHRGGKARFVYRPDGTLDSINIVLDVEE
jgi:hypothetical protein